MKEEVIVLKLSNDVELIGKSSELFDANNPKAINLKKPRVVQLMPYGDGQMGVTLMPWVVSNQDADVTLQPGHILTFVLADSRMERMYLEHTSSIKLSTSLNG
jgi:hypothetical protein